MKLHELTKDLNMIFLCKFGSHLYGTSTPDSDEDYKGVYIPTIEQCFLNDIPNSINYSSGSDNSRNTKEDIDIEIYSIHYFLKLILKGDTGAIDMLHAPTENQEIVLIHNNHWDYIRNLRSEFYTTNLSAFVGYCRTQANKYGTTASRLNCAKKFLELLSRYDSKQSFLKLSDIWEYLYANFRDNEHVSFIETDEYGANPFPMIVICGRKLQKTVTVKYAINVVEKFFYEKRVALKGIDWKVVSHAVRCAYQMKSIYKNGDIHFPLKEAPYILAVKKGELPYNFVADKLEKLMDEVEDLVKESDFPEKPNTEKWNYWLIRLLSSKYNKYNK